MMYGNNYGFNPLETFMGGAVGAWLGTIVIPLVIWSLFWKGWALWRAARDESKVWFIALLLVNTLGILDILYIFVFSKARVSKKASKKK